MQNTNSIGTSLAGYDLNWEDMVKVCGVYIPEGHAEKRIVVVESGCSSAIIVRPESTGITNSNNWLKCKGFAKTHERMTINIHQ